MAYNATILLGKITKVHRSDGIVTVKLEKNFTEDILILESVFLEIEGNPVPFIISESDHPGGDILKLRFDGYDKPEKVSEFTGCRVFLTSGNASKNSGRDPNDLKDYKVQLADNSLLGIVTGIIDNPGQSLLRVKTKEGKEILVPLHEDLVLGIDKRKKIIKMDLPEGLVEINL
jgi:16S rRNA processing protein RimM